VLRPGTTPADRIAENGSRPWTSLLFLEKKAIQLQFNYAQRAVHGTGSRGSLAFGGRAG
jgi:hypothetical protein